MTKRLDYLQDFQVFQSIFKAISKYLKHFAHVDFSSLFAMCIFFFVLLYRITISVVMFCCANRVKQSQLELSVFDARLGASQEKLCSIFSIFVAFLCSSFCYFTNYRLFKSKVFVPCFDAGAHDVVTGLRVYFSESF